MKPKSAFLERSQLASPTLLQGSPGGNEAATLWFAKAHPRAHTQLNKRVIGWMRVWEDGMTFPAKVFGELPKAVPADFSD